MFATAENRRVAHYVSPVQIVKALATDVFVVDWNQRDVLYLFPSMKMIMGTLGMLESFQGTALLIIPCWLTQPWVLWLKPRPGGV